MSINPHAGQLAPANLLVNIPKLLLSYYSERPDPSIKNERVSFGTSGHRGSSLQNSFNENHILAIAQAICHYRQDKNIDGPLYLGMDTHALSLPAYNSVIEVCAANGILLILAENDEFTPTPVISHAILTYNKGRQKGFADGIIITPSHNPPDEGGIKYNPPHGGPAETSITSWIEKRANEFLENNMQGVKQIFLEKALSSNIIKRKNFIQSYVNDLENVIDMGAIRNSNIILGVDPMGGAGVNYWEPIAERYKLNLTVVNKTVDPTFSFMPLDWDGKIRMDPSSPYAMRHLIDLKNKFQLSFACDTDHDRHGIVTKNAGLLAPNHFFSSALSYLLEHRPLWKKNVGIGKTVVSSQMLDRLTKQFGRTLFEVPVGFKWFVDGLYAGSLGFVCEESAGASFLRLDGTVWTTDKDGFIPSLLAAEMTSRTGKDPGELYSELTKKYGNPLFERIDIEALKEEREALSHLSKEQIQIEELAGEKIQEVITEAPGNGAPIGGIKVVTENGWFAVRPSGTEDIYKIYAESFLGQDHLKQIQKQAKLIVNSSFKVEQS
jgi:phosphoglucomutase